MGEEVKVTGTVPQPFNTPLECGLRALITLVESFPKGYDLQRLLYFDYLLVHSGDAGGPSSLHPALPHRSGELLVRREIVERGVLLMMSRDLIERSFADNGITYSATEGAAAFLDGLSARYIRLLCERAEWVVKQFGTFTDPELLEFFNTHIDRWGGEFVALSHTQELPF